MQFSLKSIECFVALFEEGSVTQAAQRLALSQPAVSMQLRRLEESCGIALFDRDGRGCIPTAAAERLYPECRGLLSHARTLDLLLTDTAQRIDEGISIGVPPILGRTIVPQEVLPLHNSHPALRITLREGGSPELAGWVESRKVDFAIVDVDSISVNAATAMRTLATEAIYLVTALPAASGTAQHETPLSDLSSYKLALPPAGDGVHRALRAIACDLGLSLSCRLEADSVTTLLDIARRPGWATVLPGSALRTQGRTEAWYASRIVEPRIVRNVGILRRKGQGHSAAEQWFTHRLQQALLQPFDSIC